MFELGVYFGARGVAKNGPLRPPRLKSMHFYVFSAPGGPKVRTRPKRGLKQNENSCFEHFLGVGIFRIFSGPGGVDFWKSALFASRLRRFCEKCIICLVFASILCIFCNFWPHPRAKCDFLATPGAAKQGLRLLKFPKSALCLQRFSQFQASLKHGLRP